MTQPHEIRVERTPLPGVGLRLEFVTQEGRRIGVVLLQKGGIELFVSHEHDPDLAAASLALTTGEAATLTELLGGSVFSHELSHLQRAAADIAVDWLTIEAGTRFVGRSLGDTQLRTMTGVSVVAVVRTGAAIPSPSPTFEFEEGDVVVAVGTAEGLAAAAEFFKSGA